MSALDRDKIFIEHIVNKKFSISRTGIFKNIKTKHVHNNKHLKLTFSHDKKLYSINKPRAVWLAYNGPIAEDSCVYLLKKEDGFCIDNLAVCSEAEFTAIQADKKRAPPKPKKEKVKKEKTVPNKQYSLSDEQVLALRREFKAEPFSIRAKARELKVSHPTVGNALRGLSHKHLPEDVIDLKAKSFSGVRKGTSRKGILMLNREPRVKKEPVPKKVQPRVIKEKPVKKRVVEESVTVTPTPVKTFTEQEKNKRLEIIKQAATRMRGLKT